MKPLISIVIPIYNVEQYLSTCLDSIVHQTYPHLEIVLVDDGSTDSCSEICDAYAEKDGRIKVIHKQNSGLSDARNFGLKCATGEYIALIDSDDFISLNFCDRMLNTILSNNVEIAECGFQRFENEREIFVQKENSISEDLVYQSEEALELLIRGRIKQMACNKLFKTEVIKGILFEKNRKHEDEFWTYQTIANAKNIVKINDMLYFYRQHSQSIMGRGYNLARLDGLDALEARMIFMKINYPKLFPLSFKSFWSASSAHYQNLTQKPTLDPNGLRRKTILKKVKKYKTEISEQDFKRKDLFWLHFFLLMPNVYAKCRNLVKIGI